MNTLKIPCETNDVSDGYHTFGELYEHRIILFLALMKSLPDRSWFSEKHDDNSVMAGWFIAGMNLPAGPVTYHLPDYVWPLAVATGATILPNAPKWDGHTSNHVIERLKSFIQ